MKYLSIWISAAFWGLLFCTPMATAGAPGILFLIADDLGDGDAGCYGHPVLRTPNIDRLASRGVCFTHAFATTASCSASRSVMYTGLQNHANGQYGHEHAVHNFRLLPQVETVFQSLKKAGFRTGLIGKHHVGPPEKFPIDFKPPVNARDVTRMAELAAQFLESAGDDPFFLVIAYADPHRNFGNGNPYRDVEEIKYEPADVVVPHFLPDLPETREDLAQYYQSASRLDQGIGKAIDALQSSGRADDTLVIFTSDNGMPFTGAKTNAYDPALRLPFIIERPGLSRPGMTNDAMVSFVDITPTILDWAHVKSGSPIPLHGRSILPILEQEHPKGWDKVYASHTFHEVTMYYPMRVVRNRQYKLIWNIASPLPFPFASDLYASPTWQAVLKRKLEKAGSRSVKDYYYRAPFELYDIQADPEEIHNLANDPSHAETFQSLVKDLHEFQDRTHDPWAEPRDQKLPKFD